VVKPDSDSPHNSASPQALPRFCGTGDHEWFDKMYSDVTEAGIAFTAVGIVTADPASVESVLAWASRLGNRTAYLIVENSTTEHTDFRYWRESEQALWFQQKYSPSVIRMDYRLPVLENATRNHGATLGAVASRSTDAPGAADGIAGDAHTELPATHVRRV
jgi:hypothetical protein